MVIPKWALNLINESQLKDIEKQISMIEFESDVEIVPVVVERSSDYPQTGVTLILSYLIFCLILVFFVQGSQENFWDSKAYFFLLKPVTLIIIASFSLIYLKFLLKSFKSKTLIRTFNHKHSFYEMCALRAKLEFYQERLQDIKKQNGILIFVSLLERNVIILTDQNIQSQFGNNDLWVQEVDMLTDSLKKQNLGEGLIKILNHLQPILKENFPLKVNKENSIINSVIFK